MVVTSNSTLEENKMSSTTSVTNKQIMRDEFESDRKRIKRIQYQIELGVFLLFFLILAIFSVSDGALFAPSADTAVSALNEWVLRLLLFIFVFTMDQMRKATTHRAVRCRFDTLTLRMETYVCRSRSVIAMPPFRCWFVSTIYQCPGTLFQIR